MSSSFNLKSHPNKPLEVHLLNVANFCKETVLQKEVVDKELLSHVAFLIGITHDFAKSTTYFQKYLMDHEKTEKARHGLLSSIFSYFCIKSYIEKNEIEEYWYLAPISWLIVLRHHGNINNLRGMDGEYEKLKDLEVVKRQLNDIKKNNFPALEEFYRNFDVDILNFFLNFEKMVKHIKKDIRKLSRKNGSDYYFLTLFFYSVLLDADKMDASETPLPPRTEISDTIVDDYKKAVFGNPEKDIDNIREKSYKEVINSLKDLDLQKDRILSINLPTGCGKTLSAFSFALKLRKAVENKLGFLPKIIYSLPFLSIIDQNADVLTSVLKTKSKSSNTFSNELLKHHHLSDMSYKTEKELDISSHQSQLLTEGWYSEVVITTFIQFFYSLITNKNRAARKFHNMTNSIIILDEIQSIPYHYWQLLNHTLKYLCEAFNCWIILMTATEPLIFKKEIEIKSLVPNKEKYFEKFDRINYYFNLTPVNFNEFKSTVLNEIISQPKKDFMIVLNTINASQNFYNYIKEELGENLEISSEGIAYSDNLQLINLSSLIIPDHRLKRIKKIKESEGRRNIIITTQVVEAGVDISVDYIFRDMAPLDSIVQTAGRCNRNNGRDKGQVTVVNIVDENGRNFYTYVYSSILINATLDVIGSNCLVAEKDFNLSAVPNYYDYIKVRGSQDYSTDIISYINKLKFYDLKKEFKLIENSYEKIDVFVEVDESAKEIWERYKEIMKNKNRFERKNLFLEIKTDFYNYIISVDSNKIGKTLIENEWLGYIVNIDLDRKYNIETGFIPYNQEEVFII